MLKFPEKKVEKKLITKNHFVVSNEEWKYIKYYAKKFVPSFPLVVEASKKLKHKFILFSKNEIVALNNIPLGSGSFGFVTLGICWNEKTNKYEKCAIKELYTSDGISNRELENLKEVYGKETVKQIILNNKTYLKMKYIKGEELFYGLEPESGKLVFDKFKEKIHFKRLPEKIQKLLCCLHIALKIEQLHSQDIGHFDVKSENIIFSFKDGAKLLLDLIDYGASENLKKYPNGVVYSNNLKGTMQYTSGLSDIMNIYDKQAKEHKKIIKPLKEELKILYSLKEEVVKKIEECKIQKKLKVKTNKNQSQLKSKSKNIEESNNSVLAKCKKYIKKINKQIEFVNAKIERHEHQFEDFVQNDFKKEVNDSKLAYNYRFSKNGVEFVFDKSSDVFSLGRLMLLDFKISENEFPMIKKMTQKHPRLRPSIQNVVVAIKEEIVKQIKNLYSNNDDNSEDNLMKKLTGSIKDIYKVNITNSMYVKIDNESFKEVKSPVEDLHSEDKFKNFDGMFKDENSMKTSITKERPLLFHTSERKSKKQNNSVQASMQDKETDLITSKEKSDKEKKPISLMDFCTNEKEVDLVNWFFSDVLKKDTQKNNNTKNFKQK